MSVLKAREAYYRGRQVASWLPAYVFENKSTYKKRMKEEADVMS